MPRLQSFADFIAEIDRIDAEAPEPGKLDERRRRRMAVVDRLPKDVRECVHEFKWDIVKTMIEAGVRDAAGIRRIMAVIRKNHCTTWYPGARTGPASMHGTKATADA